MSYRRPQEGGGRSARRSRNSTERVSVPPCSCVPAVRPSTPGRPAVPSGGAPHRRGVLLPPNDHGDRVRYHSGQRRVVGGDVPSRADTGLLHAITRVPGSPRRAQPVRPAVDRRQENARAKRAEKEFRPFRLSLPSAQRTAPGTPGTLVRLSDLWRRWSRVLQRLKISAVGPGDVRRWKLEVTIID